MTFVYRGSQLRGKRTCLPGSACYSRVSCNFSHVVTKLPRLGDESRDHGTDFFAGSEVCVFFTLTVAGRGVWRRRRALRIGCWEWGDGGRSEMQTAGI
jgi:hypothetical protein